jgi:hypothetical protein
VGRAQTIMKSEIERRRHGRAAKKLGQLAFTTLGPLTLSLLIAAYSPPAYADTITVFGTPGTPGVDGAPGMPGTDGGPGGDATAITPANSDPTNTANATGGVGGNGGNGGAGRERERSRSHRRCGTSGPHLGKRWPSRLVATAEEDRLSFPSAKSAHVVCGSQRLPSKSLIFSNLGPVHTALPVIGGGGWQSESHFARSLTIFVNRN